MISFSTPFFAFLTWECGDVTPSVYDDRLALWWGSYPKIDVVSADPWYTSPHGIDDDDDDDDDDEDDSGRVSKRRRLMT
eukprot:CAMPEP_0203669674 /NCGR_PEP_ID=MMETSP0090-20130426/5973_1 /ASSEMBLY_ACC=CAM_ASM_001088 /TAXON_ID=426623 /ORGANISM="Chaetoceros affinis, Strain CCMP159" /LENGTH=78 /DNA_ID=CAMNT_0050534403 /DNA_START=123 /DNA_END=360 /DNA_ORIENTATION=-